MAEEKSYELLGKLVEVTGKVVVYEWDSENGGKLQPIERVVDREPMLSLNQVVAFRRIIIGLFGYNLEIKVQPHRSKRSLAQNRYIWGVVVPCVRAWLKETEGKVWEKEEVYVWLRTGVLGDTVKITEIMGTQVLTMTGKRFSAMNTKEFTVAVETLMQKLAFQGCVVPEPRQDNFLQEFIMDT